MCLRIFDSVAKERGFQSSPRVFHGTGEGFRVVQDVGRSLLDDPSTSAGPCRVVEADGLTEEADACPTEGTMPASPRTRGHPPRRRSSQ